MTRFNTLTLVLALTAFALFTVNASAQNGVPVEDNTPDTFIDENGDGICDTYQAGGKAQGNAQGNGQSGKAYGRGDGAADGTQAKTQVRLRDGSKSGGTFGPGTGESTGSLQRRGVNGSGSDKGRGRK